MVLEFTVPVYLINFYHIIGGISLFLNLATIFLVIFKSSKIDNFWFYLLGFQVLCTITDFHLTFLMQPCPLYPILAGFCKGFLADYLWSHYIMAIIIALMIAQMECLALCFLRKHQTIGKIMNRHVISRKLELFFTFIASLVPALFFWGFYKAGMDRDKQMEFIEKKYPQYLSSFASLQNFAIYDPNLWFLFLALSALSGGSGAGFIFIFTTVDMLRMLKEAQRKVSATSYQRHRSAVKSLMAQFATSSLLLVPCILFVIVVILEFRYAQGTVQLLLALFALHSSVNSMVLVATTPPFRNFLLRRSIKPTQTIKVSHSRNSFH